NYEAPTSLWMVKSPPKQTLSGLPTANSLAFSPDSEELAIVANDGPIQLVDAARGTQRDSLGPSQGLRYTSPVAYSADRRRLVTSDGAVWDIGRRQKLWCILNPPGTVQAFAADGRHFAICYSGRVYLFRIPTDFR